MRFDIPPRGEVCERPTLDLSEDVRVVMYIYPEGRLQIL